MMAQDDSTIETTDSDDDRIDEIIAAYLQRVDAGETPDRDTFLAEHPNFAAELRSFLDDLNRFEIHADDAASEKDDLADVSTDSESETAFPRMRYFGEYELVREIARGGMGVVYEARQKNLKRIVAVKMILGGVLASDEDVQRFRTEAQAAAGLQHPGIVSIHEVGVCRGQHYFSMDYVEGSNLADQIRDGALHHDKAAAYLHRIAEAVQYAHSRGTLHRDLKPSNILIDESDAPRITDFGLAKQLHDDSSLTATGTRLGTPSYMPPEQAAGESTTVGPAGDIYSLGCILYELLTGRPPFRGSSVVQTLNMVASQTPVPPRQLNAEIPRDLENICLKCLQKLPADRYETAADLGRDLQRFMNGEPVTARPINRLERTRRRLWKHRRAIAGVVITIALAAATNYVRLESARYLESLKAEVSFDTSGAPLVTEIRDHLDRHVIPKFTTPTAQPVSLPAGDYRVRFHESGKLSEEFRVLVPKASKLTIPVELESHAVFPSVTISGAPRVVTLENHADIVVVRREGVERLDGATSRSIWKVDLTMDELLNEADTKWGEWIEDEPQNPDRRTPLVEPAPDLNGDGIGDLVWVCTFDRGTITKRPTGIIAQSGADGRILWVHRLSVPGEKAPGEAFGLRIVGQPDLARIDDDACLDLIVTSAGDGRQVEVLSGADGRILWQHVFDPVDYEGPFHWNPTATMIGTRKAECPSAFHMVVQNVPSVIAATGRSILRFNAQTGTRLQMLYTRDWPIAEISKADLDSDGSEELLVRHESESATSTVTAIDARDATILWTHDADDTTDNEHCWFTDDLDADVAADVVVASTRTAGNSGSGLMGGACTRLDPRTGKVVWTSRPSLFGNSDAKLQVYPASDLDNDGVRDVLTAHTKFVENASMLLNGQTLRGVSGVLIHVNALSGRSGKTLWSRTELDQTAGRQTRIHGIREWTDGADGCPQLIVTLFTRFRSGTSRSSTLVLSGSGRGIRNGAVQPVRVIRDAEEVDLADLNGDGHLDVYWFDFPLDPQPVFECRINAISGGSHVVWRRLGLWHPCSDLNGDGVMDLMDIAPLKHGGNADWTAISGLNGRVLWHVKGQTQIAIPLPLPHGDIDDDGGADIVELSMQRKDFICRARSGKSGRELWQHEFPRRAGEPFGSAGLSVSDAQATDFDSDGVPELVLLLTGDSQTPEVVVINAETGDIKWHSNPDPGYGGNVWLENMHTTTSSSMPSLLVGKHKGKVVAWQSLVAENGKLLWARKESWERNYRRHVRMPLPMRDVDADGDIETIHVDHRVRAFSASAVEPDWTFSLLQILGSRPGTTDSATQRRVAVRTGQPVLADLEGNGRFVTCLSFENRLVAIDHRGRLVGNLQIPERWLRNSVKKERLFSMDLDGDGRDELITTAWIPPDESNPRAQPQHVVLAFRLILQNEGAAIHTLWEWPMPFGFGDIMELRRTADDEPRIIACSGSTIFEIEGLTGKIDWTCDGPRWWSRQEDGLPNSGTYFDRRPVVMQHSTQDRPARVFFRRYRHHDQVFAVDCRYSTAVD